MWELIAGVRGWLRRATHSPIPLVSGSAPSAKAGKYTVASRGIDDTVPGASYDIGPSQWVPSRLLPRLSIY